MLDLSVKNKQIVTSILAHHLPKDVKVYVFGSRIHHNKARRYSDLDLVVKAEQALPRPVLFCIEEAFEESILPIRIDLLDWHRISPEFQSNIKDEMQPLGA